MRTLNLIRIALVVFLLCWISYEQDFYYMQKMSIGVQLDRANKLSESLVKTGSEKHKLSALRRSNYSYRDY